MGSFLSSAGAVMLAEFGGKAQIATVALAARFAQLVPATLGTTCGLMLAIVPAIMLGDRMAGGLPHSYIHVAAALRGAAISPGPDCAAPLAGSRRHATRRAASPAPCRVSAA
ncbi:MAG: TMEM165/GDT1 family protein [Proteobacteria bacterium]|nr:TMEM165/GDT1 family protein [Pseudomonadota bacterium]